MSIINRLLSLHFYEVVSNLIQTYGNFTDNVKDLYDYCDKAHGIQKQIINSYIMTKQIDIKTHINIVPDNAEFLSNTKQFKYNGKLTQQILIFFTVDTPCDENCSISIRPTHYLAVSHKKLYKVSANHIGFKYYRWLISDIYHNFGKIMRYYQ